MAAAPSTVFHPSLQSNFPWPGDGFPMFELEIKHKHGGFNINYEKATVVWQQFGFGS
jgi:hypothetical protein